MTEERARPVLYLVDGTSNIFRAFYAVRGLSSPSGRPTNATFGFTQMLQKLLQERNPEFLAVVFDRPEPTHRHTAYADYKANRMAPPEDLVEQIPDIKEVCRVLGVPTVELAGYEADDLMATIAHKASVKGFDVLLVSSDKDLLQLVNDSVKVLHPSKGEVLDREAVRTSFGVYPERVIDVLALMGDSSDNVPGVPGIGEKGARELVAAYGGLEECLHRASEISRKTYRENLLRHASQARLSRELVTLRADAPVEWLPDGFRRQPVSVAEARGLFLSLGFSRLIEGLGTPEASTPAYRALRPEPIVTRVDDEEALQDMIRAISGSRSIALAPVFSESQPMRAHLAGLGLAHSPEAVYFLPLSASTESTQVGISEKRLWEALEELLSAPRPGKQSDDLKSLEVYLLRRGVRLCGGELDSTLVAYLLDPEARDYRLARLEESVLGIAMHEPKGPSNRPAEAEAEIASAAECRALLALEAPLMLRLKDQGLERLYRELELPLTSVLAAMEFAGVKLDTEFLRSLSVQWQAELRKLESQIHALAGGPFNIQSPRQLGEILFEKLGLTPGRKTEKERAFSTGGDVLESLASSHPLPAAVLEYRSLSKLLSTYVDALPELVNPATGRVHASFNQTAAATGRLSSSDPNLQNIPIRTQRGREIRRAFVAEEGWSILTADYSQIELRVLAHLSQDPEMIRAFQSHEDIHRRTAAEVFSVAPDLVTSEMRNQAKAINFGILYGMGPFRLSRDLGISLPSAKKIIEEYFRRFQGVRRYMDGVVESAERTGRVSTMFGRIRNVPEIRSRNTNQKNLGIRVAINTTVQGSAADLIKAAMVALDKRLRSAGLRSRLIIQVHDELVVEAPHEEVDRTGILMQECMEGSTRLGVPLVAEVRSGPTWLDTK